MTKQFFKVGLWYELEPSIHYQVLQQAQSLVSFRKHNRQFFFLQVVVQQQEVERQERELEEEQRRMVEWEKEKRFEDERKKLEEEKRKMVRNTQVSYT